MTFPFGTRHPTGVLASAFPKGSPVFITKRLSQIDPVERQDEELRYGAVRLGEASSGDLSHSRRDRHQVFFFRTLYLLDVATARRGCAVLSSPSRT